MHRRVSPSLHLAASRPAIVRVEEPPFDMSELPSTECCEECSAVAAHCNACSLLSHYQAMTLQPARCRLVQGLASLTTHLRRNTCLPAGVLLRRFAGGEMLRNLLLPLECTAAPLRQARQSTRLQLCPRMHPGQTANNGVTERREGRRSAFTRRQGNKAAVRRRSRS
jgi:hypothetical protein